MRKTIETPPPKTLSLKEDDSLFDGQQSVDIDNSSTR